MNELVFDKLLSNKSNVQGVVGVLSNNATEVIFKLSKRIDFIVEHEHDIYNFLNDLHYTGHFPKMIGMVKTQIDAMNKNKVNPFSIISNHPVDANVLLLEKINVVGSLSSFIEDININTKTIICLMQQVLMAIAIAQQEMGFTHYDLHSDNILVCKCDHEIIVYNMGDKKIAVPTYGYKIVIIDFGRSVIGSKPIQTFTGGSQFTNIGITTVKNDNMFDAMNLLIFSALEIANNRVDKLALKYKTLIQNIYFPIKKFVDIDNATFFNRDIAASEIIEDKLNYMNINSLVFTEYLSYSIDIINALCVYPSYEHVSIHESFLTFYTEWKKIECEITSPYYNLYLLKIIVEILIEIKNVYRENEDNSELIISFSNKMFYAIKQVAAFCNPKKIDYKRLIDGMYLFSKAISYIYTEEINRVISLKNKAYSKLQINSVVDIVDILSVNLITKQYNFKAGNIINEIDMINKKAIVYPLFENKIRLLQGCNVLTEGVILCRNDL